MPSPNLEDQEIYVQEGVQTKEEKPFSKWAIAAVVSFVLLFLPLPFISEFSGLYLILTPLFSVIGIIDTRKNRKRGKYLAVALLIISIVFSIWLIIALASFFSTF